MHPKVLGNASPAMYAGDLRIKMNTIVDLTNLSGAYRLAFFLSGLSEGLSGPINWSLVRMQLNDLLGPA
jgi:hypothetical protein